MSNNNNTLKENLEYFHDKEVHIPTRSILLSGEVDLDTFNTFFKNLHILDQSVGDVFVYINSEGGDLDQGRAIYDLIKGCQNHITGIVYGEASSAASLILQACDKRRMSPSSYMMLHIGEEATGGHPENKKRWDEKYTKDTEHLMDVYLERIKEKKPRFTKKKLTDILRFDTILNGYQAIELGLLDEVI